MKTMFRKELVETVVPTLPMIVSACAIMIGSVREESVFLARDDEPSLVMLGCAGFFGLAAGFLRFALETWNGSWPYLVHRGDGHRGIFLAKSAACFVLTALASAGVVLVFALWHRAFSSLAPVLEWHRLGELVLLSTFGFSACAAGVLAAQIRRAPWATIGFALAVPAGLFLVSFVLVQSRALVVFGLVQLVTTVVLLSIAYALFRRPRDRDLALRTREHAALTLSAGVLLVLGCAGGIAIVQNELLRELYERQPTFVRDAGSDRFFALPAEEYGDYFRKVHFGSEGATSARAPLPVYERLYNPRMTVSGEPRIAVPSPSRRAEELYVHPPGTSYYLAANGAFRTRAFLDHAQGSVRILVLPSEMYEVHRLTGESPAHLVMAVPDVVLPEPPPFERVLTKPDGRSFSAATRVLRAGTSIVALADPEDRTLWRIDPANPNVPLVAIGLPDGDSFVALESAYERTAATNGRREFRNWLVVGTRGRYVWTALGRTASPTDSFARFDPEDQDLVAAADVEGIVERRVNVSDRDPIEPVVEVRDAETAQVLAVHRFAPANGAERSLATMLCAGALLRPTLVNVASYLRPQREPHELWRTPTPHRELLFAGHSRPLLLALHVALTLAAAGLAARSLRRRQAARSSVLLTVTWILASGFAGYVVHRILEPRATQRREPAEAESAAAPVLRLERA